jgi:hypothetical protein
MVLYEEQGHFPLHNAHEEAVTDQQVRALPCTAQELLRVGVVRVSIF